MLNYITITDYIYLLALKLGNYYSKKIGFYGSKFVISRLIYE